MTGLRLGVTMNRDHRILGRRSTAAVDGNQPSLR